MSDAHEALIGRVIAGKFRVDALVGAGAMGAVFRARQIALDKDVAIKVMHAHAAAGTGFAERFHREAVAASRLDHPNSVRVIDHGVDGDGVLYIAMELLSGRDLFTLMGEEWPLGDARIVDILSQALAALAVAHELGIVHRDLKPENIMVLPSRDDDGRATDLVKVCDFGIAQLARSEERDGRRLTTEGIVVGTPEYMSPEQARGEPVDARSDLYSMGVILFRLLTGRPPFEAESALGVALKHVTDPPPLPSTINPNVHRGLEAVALRALSKRPAERFDSARAMRSALRRAIDDRRGPQEITGPNPALAPELFGVAATAVALSAEAVRSGSDGQAKSQTGEPVSRRPPSAESSGAARASEASGAAGSSGARAAEAGPSRSSARWMFPALALSVIAAAAGFGLRERWSAARGAPSSGAAPGVVMAPSMGRDEAASPSGAPSSAERATAASTGPSPAVASAPAIASGGAAPTAGGRGVGDRGMGTSGGAPTSAIPSNEGGSSDAAATTTTATATTTTTTTAASATASVAPVPTTTATVATATPSATATATATAVATSAITAAQLDGARVSIGAVSSPSGISGAAVKNALNGASMSRCYRDALKAAGTAASGSGTLSLSMDESGRIVGARLSTSVLPSMRGCIEAAARGATVRGVDTGDATATVSLSFSTP